MARARLMSSFRYSAMTFCTVEPAGKYVYAISGLRTDESPCSTLARWKRLDSGTPTGLATDDEELIREALERLEGSLRDINVKCSKSGVPANSVIALSDGQLFQHVHLEEHSVYDFTDWVEKHPGGSSKLTQWASKGFIVVFPSWHDMDRFEFARTNSLKKGFMGCEFGSQYIV